MFFLMALYVLDFVLSTVAVWKQYCWIAGVDIHTRHTG